MQKMKMSVCWMFVILLGCVLLHICQSESTDKPKCNHKLKTVCITERSNVSISCPNISGQDFGFTLYKDGEVICNYLYNFGSPTTNCTMNMSMDVRLKRGNNSSTFILNGVTAAQYGIYRCEGNVMYPPPYVSDYTALGKLVLVDGHLCTTNKSTHAPPVTLVVHHLPWIWISAITVLCIYSIVVTIIAVFNYIKLKHSDCQSDYMNTKPRATKDRKKKRGLENPIPRHF